MRQRTEKVLVTGGAGFLGSHLVDRLLADTTAEVIVLDNLQRGRLSNLAQHAHSRQLSIIQGDIRDRELVAQTVRGTDVVFHLAAQSTVMGAAQDLDYSFSTNVVGTFNVLQAAARASVRRLIFASSREVYGEPIDLPVDEGQPLLAINLYGASKVMGEAYCRAYRRAYGLSTLVLRVANTYGTRDFGRVIPLFIEQAMRGHDLLVYGGKQVLDFVWVDQVVNAFMRAAELDYSTPPVNVGSGTGTRIVDLARRISALTGRPSQVRLVPARPEDVVQYVGRVDRMRDLLGVDPGADPLAYLPELVPSPLAALVT